MAITVTTFGRNILNEIFILQAVTDNPTDVKFMRLEIGGLFFENEPEIGTNDTFRFEINNALSVGVIPVLPELLTYNISNNNTEIEGTWSNLTLTELEADGTEADTLNKAYYLKGYNLFRNQSLSTFNCGDDGSSNSKFLTNSANTIRVNKDDFIWLFSDQTDYNSNPTTTAKQEIVLETYLTDGTLADTTTYDCEGSLISPLYGYLSNTLQTKRPNPVGFQIKINHFTSTNLDRLNVFIRDKTGGIVRSETKILREYTGSEFVKLWWINQYNAPELTYMEGREIRQVDNEQFLYLESEPVNPTAFDGGRKLFANKVTKSYQLNTGNKSPDEIIYLSEMLHAGQLVIEKEGQLIPVRITNTNFNNFNSKDSIFNLEVDLQEVKDTLIY